MAKIIEINKETCIGCGTCEALCPQVFHLDDAGKAEVIPNHPDDLSCIQEAIESCPVQVISLK